MIGQGAMNGQHGSPLRKAGQAARSGQATREGQNRQGKTQPVARCLRAFADHHKPKHPGLYHTDLCAHFSLEGPIHQLNFASQCEPPIEAASKTRCGCAASSVWRNHSRKTHRPPVVADTAHATPQISLQPSPFSVQSLHSSLKAMSWYMPDADQDARAGMQREDSLSSG